MLRFSTYEESFDELLENEGLKKKAAKSGISLGTLKKVYNRGMAAWRTGHRPGTTPQQWGMARVNSYITKGKGTYYGADSDLSGKGKKEKKEAAGVKKKKQTNDWIKDSVALNVDRTVRHLILMRTIVFVTKTVHIDRYGLKIFKSFYTDSQGRELSDFYNKPLG